MFEVKDPKYLELIKTRVTRLLKFDCSQYTDNFLKRRFEVRLRKNNIDTYFNYLKLLEDSKNEQAALKKELTIHVTHFFRDKEFWQVFKDSIIPKLIEHKKSTGARSIKIWSAGCSSGEEPLSIAICFNEKLRNEINEFKITISGTDYDQEIIAKARQAYYDEHQFNETDRNIKQRYFTKTGDNRYHANSTIQSMINYGVGDILKDAMPRNTDIIFCRNTVIYFNAEAKSGLYVKFYDILNNGGFFIMGKTEFLNGPAREVFCIENSRERIYHKTGV